MRCTLFLLCALAACAGAIEPGASSREASAAPGVPGEARTGGSRGPNPSTPAGGGAGAFPSDPGLFGASGLRRLSREEYRATVRDLTGVDVAGDLALLPADAPSTYFDNDYTTQVASAALVEGLRAVAGRVADAVTADAARMAKVLPCTPAGPADGACLRQFIRVFGTRALRRPIADAEIDRYAAFQSYAASDGRFATAVGLVMRAMLQELEFLYRVEVGTPVAGRASLFRLDGFELASRLSYLLWGCGPDDDLLARAAGRRLEALADVRAAAASMLQSPKAAARIARLHALWLSYDRLPHDAALATAMHVESDALVSKIVLQERRPWIDLFTATETYVDAALARQYSLPAASGGAAAWVPYGGSGRRGILSHGSVLSNGLKFGDTSPVQRGIFVRNRLFCQEIPPPDAAATKVNADQPPAAADPGACKAERYAQHRADPACASCHRLMDPVGMGLESFDGVGRFRKTEPDKPSCTIEGKGDVVGVPGVSSFSGPGELGTILAASPQLPRCFVSQFYQFALGRPLRDGADDPALDAIASRFADGGRYQFIELLLEFVSAPAFRHRMAD